MAVRSVISVSLVLRYQTGSFTYSYLKTTAGSNELFEVGGAISSLQAEPVKSVNKVVTSRIIPQ